MPPSIQRIVSDMPYRSAPSVYISDESLMGCQALTWRWPDEPVQVWSGLAMKVSP